MVLKSVFSSDLFRPLFLPSLGGGSAHDWGGGGRAGATDFGLEGQLVQKKGPWQKGPFLK